MVAGIINLFMGTVSGAYLNPAVSIAIGARGNFPWKRVPAYILAQILQPSWRSNCSGPCWASTDRVSLTLLGHGVSNLIALITEIVLTAGLVSVILGTASGAQAVGPIAARGVGSYIVLAGLWAALVSGASMNPARSLGPALVLNDRTSWWCTSPVPSSAP